MLVNSARRRAEAAEGSSTCQWHADSRRVERLPGRVDYKTATRRLDRTIIMDHGSVAKMIDDSKQNIQKRQLKQHNMTSLTSSHEQV